MTRREVIGGLFGAAVLSLLKTRDLFAASEWTPEIIQLAKDTEAKYHLPHGICRAMNMQENSGKLRVAKPRTEQGYFNVGGQHTGEVTLTSQAFLDSHPECTNSLDLERAQEAISWGPWQLMGFNLRALGCEACDLGKVTLEEHFDLWGRFMSGIWKRSHGDLYKALRYYNGPRMPYSYYTHVKTNMQKFTY